MLEQMEMFLQLIGPSYTEMKSNLPFSDCESMELTWFLKKISSLHSPNEDHISII
jgi:hypothetical protein